MPKKHITTSLPHVCQHLRPHRAFGGGYLSPQVQAGSFFLFSQLHPVDISVNRWTWRHCSELEGRTINRCTLHQLIDTARLFRPGQCTMHKEFMVLCRGFCPLQSHVDTFFTHVGLHFSHEAYLGQMVPLAGKIHSQILAGCISFCRNSSNLLALQNTVERSQTSSAMKRYMNMNIIYICIDIGTLDLAKYKYSVTLHWKLQY